MSIAARTDTAEQRSAIYARLMQRNRLVDLLRFGLPVIGGIIFVALILQIYVGSLARDYGFANISIDRDNLLVESPTYTSTGSDGTIYEMAAQSARAAFDDADLIYLKGAAIGVKQPDGNTIDTAADMAQMRVSSQVFDVDGIMHVKTSTGVFGTLGDATIDVSNQTIDAPAGADLTFDEEGSRVIADTMTYRGETQIWRFTKATLVLEETPGELAYTAGKSGKPATP